jgi:phage FluMu protein Com
MRNLKARNCENVLDSSSDVPLEMKECRCEVVDTVMVESSKKSKYEDK